MEDPNAKRNHVNPVGAKPTALSKIKEKRQLEKGVFQKKIELARKNRRLAVEKKKKVKQAKQNFHRDLWSEQGYYISIYVLDIKIDMHWFVCFV